MPRLLRVLRQRLRSLLRRGAVEGELDRELQLHLDQLVREQRAAGLSEAETALALGVTDRTVRRDWTLARAFLQRELGRG